MKINITDLDKISKPLAKLQRHNISSIFFCKSDEFSIESVSIYCNIPDPNKPNTTQTFLTL